MNRSATKYLEQWKTKTKRKPLVLRGARQVGKTHIVREFAKNNFKEYLEINLEKSPKYGKLFIENEPAKIVKILEVEFGKKIDLENCLLFIDEIQEFPEVYQKLRYFYEDMPKLALIVAGSLLDFIFLKKSFSVPVGRLDFLNLEPFTFYEYLQAKKEDLLLNELKNFQIKMPLNEILHEKALKLFFEFCIVGGMPEVIETYLTTNSFIDCNETKSNLIQTYREDFNKYAKSVNPLLINKVFQASIKFAGNKVKYVNIDRDNPSAKIAEALNLLETAKLFTPVYHSSCNQLPLGSEVNEKSFKHIFLDTGLYLTMCGLSNDTFNELESFMTINSGRLFEQALGRQLIGLKKPFESREMYYWVREKKSSSAEVDYVINLGNQIIPIEAKAGKSGRLRSLHYFVKEKKSNLAIRVNISNATIHNTNETLSSGEEITFNLLSIPIYLTESLETILTELLQNESL